MSFTFRARYLNHVTSMQRDNGKTQSSHSYAGSLFSWAEVAGLTSPSGRTLSPRCIDLSEPLSITLWDSGKAAKLSFKICLLSPQLLVGIEHINEWMNHDSTVFKSFSSCTASKLSTEIFWRNNKGKLITDAEFKTVVIWLEALFMFKYKWRKNKVL